MFSYKKLLSDTFLMFLGTFSSKALVFLLLPVYTYLLTTEEYGVVDLFTTTILFLFPILTLSISDATFRFAFDKDVNQNSNLSFSICIILVSIIFILPILFILGYWNSYFLKFKYLFILLYFSVCLQTCLSNYSRGCDKVAVFVKSGLLYSISLIVFNFIFLYLYSFGINGYISSLILANFVSIIYISFKLKLLKIKFKIDYNLAKDMLKFSTPIIFSTVSWMGISSCSKFYIVDIFGVNESGLYAVAQKIPTILSVMGMIFLQAWQISAIQAYTSEDKNEFYSTVYEAYSFILFFSAGILIFLTKPIASILFLKEYYSAFIFSPILILSGVFACLSLFLQSPFVAAKKNRMLLYSSGAGFIVCILVTPILMYILGTIGAAYGALFAFVVTWFIRGIASKSIVNIDINFFKSFLSLILLLISSYFITEEKEYDYLVSLIVIIILVFLNYKIIYKILFLFLQKCIDFKYKR